MNTKLMMIEAVVTIIAFLIGKYVFPKLPPDTMQKLILIEAWADKYVHMLVHSWTERPERRK